MKKILSINAGSSSLKFQLIEMPTEKVLAKGLMERIGLKNSVLNIDYQDGRHEKSYRQIKNIANHPEAVKLLFHFLNKFRMMNDERDIIGVGHRVAAGGELFQESTLITDEVIHQIESLNEYAPLHNPAQATVIRAFRKILPDTLMVAVFDSSFHTTLPEHHYLYSIPYEYYEKYKIRKYGAHGTSHQYVAKRAAELLERPIEQLKLITCHLGNGASITAVDKGESVDTSMSFTPLAGLTMGTRSGDVDSSVIPFLMEKLELKDVNEVMDIFNKKSGLLGISGISSDMRDIQEAANRGNHRAELALKIFVNRVQKYIGSYIATMNGVDAIVFTAGIGENSPTIRQEIMEGMSWFGIEIDSEKNNTRAEAIVSTAHSKVAVLNIPTNEEIEIAREVQRLSKEA